MKRTGFLLASAMAFVVCLAVPALASSGSSLPHNPGGPGVSGAGGTAFTDSNDFGEAFDKVEKDISSYYILGYSSTNAKQDGMWGCAIGIRARPDREVRAIRAMPDAVPVAILVR